MCPYSGILQAIGSFLVMFLLPPPYPRWRRVCSLDHLFLFPSNPEKVFYSFVLSGKRQHYLLANVSHSINFFVLEASLLRQNKVMA